MINLFVDSKALYQFMLCNRIIIPLTNIESRPKFLSCRLKKTNGELIMGNNSAVCVFVVINNIG